MCDLPATRKICGFSYIIFFSTWMFKEFHCARFGERQDTMGLNGAEWTPKKHSEHMKQVFEVMAAPTATGSE
jgi:hypothetical protein